MVPELSAGELPDARGVRVVVGGRSFYAAGVSMLLVSAGVFAAAWHLAGVDRVLAALIAVIALIPAGVGLSRLSRRTIDVDFELASAHVLRTTLGLKWGEREIPVGPLQHVRIVTRIREGTQGGASSVMYLVELHGARGHVELCRLAFSKRARQQAELVAQALQLSIEEHQERA